MRYDARETLTFGEAVVNVFHYPDGGYRFEVKDRRLALSRLQPGAKGTNVVLVPTPEPPGARP